MAKKMTDEDIAQVLNAGIKQAVGYGDTRLSKEREKVQKYRDGTLPIRSGGNDSSFVSLDVYEGQESMKAQLMEVFQGNKRPVRFDPDIGETVEEAKVRTDYVHSVIFDQNRGFGILNTQIDNGLSTRTSVAKVWWEKEEVEEDYTLTDATLQELGAFLTANEGAKVKRIEAYPEDADEGLNEDGEPVHKCIHLTIHKDRSRCRVAVLPPEEFGISARSTNLETSDICFHRQRKSMSDLRKMGFKGKDLDDLESSENVWLDMSPEVQARFAPTDDTILSNGLENGDGKKTCLLYEAYAELDVDGEGKTQLWKGMLVGSKLLHKEKVERRPFVPFTPLPRPHSFWGHNYSLQLVAIQNARTYLTRSIINHALISNNPMRMVVKGAVMNPRELLENKYGGIVNVTRPDGIIPLPQAGLNPFVFQTIEMLKASKEEITGISALARGLDKDAISKQNSGSMVHELISVSEIRQKIIARNFAENFLRDLYTMVYRLVCENEDRQRIASVAGTWKPVDFTKWPADTTMSVSLALGYGEADREAMKWMNVHKFLGSDPSFAPNYGPEERYEVVRRGLEASGVHDIDKVWRPPAKAIQPPPNPIQEADLEVKKADAEVKRANAQAALAGIQAKREANSQKAQVDMGKLQHSIAVDAAELALEREMVARAPQVEARAVINAQG